MNQPRFWFILRQDVDRPIGGVKQIYAVASIISNLGFSVSVVQGTSEFRPSWFPSSEYSFHTVGNKDFSFDLLDPLSDIVVIPETFLPLLPKLKRFPVVIFNQNMHYLFGEKIDLNPAQVLRAYSSPNIIAVWTVSASDYNYALDLLPLPPQRIHRIINAIEDDLFSFSFSTAKSISYMPRKNSSHSSVVTALIKTQSWFVGSGWTFNPIHNKTHADVSSILSDSSIFLAFGYPEGFGLPLAEAIVSGCIVVGYDGIGGSEIFDLCKPYDVVTSVPFRDFHLFVKGVRDAIRAFDQLEEQRLHTRLSQASGLVSSRYSSESMANTVKAAIKSILSS